MNRHGYLFPALLALILAAALVAGCGSKDEPDAVVEDPAKASRDEAKPAGEESNRSEPKKVEEAMASVQEALQAREQKEKGQLGSKKKIPEALDGVWEKAGQPLKGSRIEFTVVDGMVSGKLVRGPDTGADVVAFYLERNEGIKGKAEQLTNCLAEVWKPGVMMFTEVLKKDAKTFWAKQNKKFIVHDPCNVVKGAYRDVIITLTDPDTLEAVMPIKSAAEPVVDVWKRARSEAPAADSEEKKQ